MLSIFLNQPSSVISTRLTVFYNFKSFKSNRSTSPFRQRIKRLLVILKALIKAFYPTQWLDFPLAALLLKILFLAVKTSLLVLPSLRAITLLPYHVLSLPLLLLLCQLFPFCFLWANTWKMTSSRSLGLFWILYLLFLFWPLH